MNKLFTGSWIGVIALITARSFLQGNGLPAPSKFIAANILWSGLAVLATAGPEYTKLATILGAGYVTGLLITNNDVLLNIKPPSSGLAGNQQGTVTPNAGQNAMNGVPRSQPSPVTAGSVS